MSDPITRRKLLALGLNWPLSTPSDLDDPIDIDAYGTGLSWSIADNRDNLAANRHLLDKIDALTARLDELGIAWKRAPAPAPAPAPPARAGDERVTLKELCALGLAYPSGPEAAPADAAVAVGRGAGTSEVEKILAAGPRLRGFRFLGGAPTVGGATATLEEAGFTRVASGAYARRVR